MSNWARRRRKLGYAVEAVPAAPAAGPIKRPVAELEAENARLRRELTSLKLDNEILRKAAYFARGVAVKYAWIEDKRGLYPAARLCRMLGVSRSGYLQWRGRPPSDRAQANAVLDAQVALVHANSGRSYGRPRIQRALRAQGIRAGHERIRRSLCRQCLGSVYRRVYRVTTDSRHTHPIAPIVLARRFEGWKPDRAWVADITYVSTDEGWLYFGLRAGSGHTPCGGLVALRAPWAHSSRATRCAWRFGDESPLPDCSLTPIAACSTPAASIVA